MEKQPKSPESIFVQTEICAKNLALSNVNYSISDIIKLLHIMQFKKQQKTRKKELDS
jgi:hypothetical protein